MTVTAAERELCDLFGFPAPPDDLADYGRAMWLYTSMLFHYRKEPHLQMLLVQVRDTAIELGRIQDALAEATVMVSGSKGQTVAHPLLAEVRAHRIMLQKMLASLVDAMGESADTPIKGTGRERSVAGRTLADVRWRKHPGHEQ